MDGYLGGHNSIFVQIRLSPELNEYLREYQRHRKVGNRAHALRQLFRMGLIWQKHMVTGGGKPYNKWYIPEDDVSLRTFVDELTDEQRDRILLELTKRYVDPKELQWLRDLANNQLDDSNERDDS